MNWYMKYIWYLRKKLCELLRIAPGIHIFHIYTHIYTYRCVAVCMKDMSWNGSIVLKNEYLRQN